MPIALVVYAFVNLLFVYKYASRAGIPAWGAVAAYLALVAILMPARRGLLAPAIERRLNAPAYWIVVGLAAAGLALFMGRFDPAIIRVSRYPALHEWIGRVLAGQFPYASGVHPSGFPFLFACALPFHWLGDLGLMQIAAFLAFSWACLRAARGSPGVALYPVVLLLASPLFLFEVAVRSELTSNTILVLLFLAWIEQRASAVGAAGADDPAQTGAGLTAAHGVVAGLLLSTRGIVSLIYTLAFTAVFRRQPAAGTRFVLVTLLTFVATLVPFLLWDPGRFLAYGPFAIQLSYISSPLLVAALGVAALLGTRVASWAQLYRFTGFVLAATVAAVFAYAVVREGWTSVLTGNGFDIAYFAFAQTFLVYSLARPPGRAAS